MISARKKPANPHNVILKEPRAAEGSRGILPLDRDDGEPPVNDRLSAAKKFATELYDSRLREIKSSYDKRWTDDRKSEQSQRIKASKPWETATGPKTREGKIVSSLNRCLRRDAGAGDKMMLLWLRLQDSFRRYVTILHINSVQDHPSVLLNRVMTLEKLLRQMRKDLEAAGVLTAALDARLLMRQGGNFSDADLITEAMCPLTPEVIEKTLNLLARRLEGEPVSRIAGEREFYGLNFKLSPDTLDPRPDTETLIDAALKRLRSSSGVILKEPQATEVSRGILRYAQDDNREKPLRILDLGTGTGCILITLLKELPLATGVAIDINPGAIAMARENAALNGVTDRIEFRTGSWLDPVEEGEAFDLIVSNPPYIPESDIESLAKEVRNHDPILALSGGVDGLDAYKLILNGIKKHLACDGFALFEIGKGQEKDLARLVDDSNMCVLESYPDLAGILRVVEITHGEK